MVAHTSGGRGVASSSLVIPTNREPRHAVCVVEVLLFLQFFLSRFKSVRNIPTGCEPRIFHLIKNCSVALGHKRFELAEAVYTNYEPRYSAGNCFEIVGRKRFVNINLSTRIACRGTRPRTARRGTRPRPWQKNLLNFYTNIVFLYLV